MISPQLSTVYVSDPVNKQALSTLEFHHQGFVDDNGVNKVFRFVESRDSMVPVDCPLESSAPRDAGETVTFKPAPMSVGWPEMNDNGYADLPISLGDMTLEIEEQLDKALDTPGTLQTIHRIYILDLDTGEITGPENNPILWSLQGESHKDGVMTATASLVDIVNRPFPRNLYTPDFAPGLVR